MTSEDIQQLRSMHYIELRCIAASFWQTLFVLSALPNPVLQDKLNNYLYTAFVWNNSTHDSLYNYWSVVGLVHYFGKCDWWQMLSFVNIILANVFLVWSWVLDSYSVLGNLCICTESRNPTTTSAWSLQFNKCFWTLIC